MRSLKTAIEVVQIDLVHVYRVYREITVLLGINSESTGKIIRRCVIEIGTNMTTANH